MSYTKYSDMEPRFEDQESFEYRPKSYTYRIQQILASRWILVILAFAAGLSAALGGVQLSQRVQEGELDFLSPAGDIKVQFQYDDRYPGPPTMESEYAWLDLLPDGLGAVQHDGLSDSIVTLSVFHQLHCLMALRHAVYDSWNETRHSRMTPHHSRHCLEYLRQSIMCNADTNIEYRVVSENGFKETPGWDVKRCRNFDRALDWAQEWRAFDGKIPSKKKEIVDPEGLKGRVIIY